MFLRWSADIAFPLYKQSYCTPDHQVKLEANGALGSGGVRLRGVEPISKNLIVSGRAKMTLRNRQWVEHDKQSFHYFLENAKTLARGQGGKQHAKAGFRYGVDEVLNRFGVVYVQ